ncbi:10057_t:CDS:2, partial [Dentiscutata erythropus]
IKEKSNCPQSLLIKLFDKNITFYYEIIKEGTYLLSNQYYYTKNPKYRIPNNYVIKTRHSKAKHLVECAIQYINKKPLFTIRFGANLKMQIQSTKSASNIACQYLKAIEITGINEQRILVGNMELVKYNKIRYLKFIGMNVSGKGF